MTRTPQETLLALAVCALGSFGCTTGQVGVDQNANTPSDPCANVTCDTACVDGTCVPVTPCDTNGDCVAPHDTCRYGSTYATTTTCSAPGGVGERCDEVADCAVDLACHEEICAANLGVACGSAVDCQSGFCADGVCCQTACTGDCDRCDTSGDGSCVPDSGLCGEACGVCDETTGNCQADDSLCTGNCDVCTPSGGSGCEVLQVSGDPSPDVTGRYLHDGSSDEVNRYKRDGLVGGSQYYLYRHTWDYQGSNTAWFLTTDESGYPANAAPWWYHYGVEFGTFDSGTGLATGNPTADASSCTSAGATKFNCTATAALCTGNCDTCVGQSTAFNCAADSSLCAESVACTGADTSFSCEATVVESADYYVAPDGNDVTNDGTEGHPFATLTKAWSVVSAGDLVYLRGGTYWLSGRVTLSGKNGGVGNLIRVWAYPGETPVFSPSENFSNTQAIVISGDYLHFKGLEVTGFEQLDGGSFYWAIVAGNANHCIFEGLNVHHNGFGFSISTWNDTVHSTDNLVLNSDFHHNSDPLTYAEGNQAYGGSDGLTIRVKDPNAVNTVRGCRFWWNSDDGVDLWTTEGMIIFEDNWSFWNGFKPGTFETGGDGNGFKLGPTFAPGMPLKRQFYRNLAFQNRMWGFEDNNARCNMELYNNTAYQNCYQGTTTFCGGYHFALYPDVPYYMRNNVGYNDVVETRLDDLTHIDHNTWDSAVNVTDADFKSVTPTGVTGPRKPDGGLPDVDFLHLAEGSDLIDAGVDVGLPYSDDAPDLGAFESL
ncbi:MAG: hypothetical protein A2289_03290 [Deltaproteobacteria bacterium RIFOXYA12_FULL_58_15]|nr:MAG: hypothetical protein A2289_03290 [Deltaproteobacteria bacterium RIFOXYA12_FULL_58_15]